MKLKTPQTSLQKPIPPTQEVHLNLEGLAVSDETLLTFHSHLKKKRLRPMLRRLAACCMSCSCPAIEQI